MMKLLRLVAVIAVLLSASANARECLHHDSSGTEIEGHISRGEILGYDKSDASHLQPQYSWYFNAATPFCLTADAGSDDLPVKSETRFMLWPSNTQPDLSQYLDLPVKITGRFLPSQIPHFHPYPIFSISSVTVRDAP
jgi:hypothetical protein